MLVSDYWVEKGFSQHLGRYDMGLNDGVRPEIAVDQCVVQVAPDGSCVYAYAQGIQPTGWRTSPMEPWTWMQPGESVALGFGHKISLDCNDPESAVFKLERSGTGAALPMGWFTEIDAATGRQYYFNQQTGVTQWESPTM